MYKNIAIFIALQLGDLLCIIPAVRALKNHLPNVNVTLITLPGSKFIVERFPQYFNNFIPFPGYPGLPEQVFDESKFSDFLSLMNNKNFDLVIQMQGNGSIVNSMIDQFGAKQTAGFRLNNDSSRDPKYYLIYPDHGHEIERHLALMHHLGIPSSDRDLEFPVDTTDEDEFRSTGLNLRPGTYICVHPGSRGSWRRWPPSYFAALADECAAKGFEIVITGTKEETELGEQVAACMDSTPVLTMGRTTLGAVAVLIRDSFGLISNCTGVSHIAAALKKRSIIISLDGEPERWGPLDKQIHRTIDWTTTPDFELALKETKELFSLA